MDGSPYVVMAKHNVSHFIFMDSVWYVVEAVYAVKEWYIMCPLDHEKTKRNCCYFQIDDSLFCFMQFIPNTFICCMSTILFFLFFLKVYSLLLCLLNLNIASTITYISFMTDLDFLELNDSNDSLS